MADHKFRIGQSVIVTPGSGPRAGVATIIRLMPAGREDLDPQYRVKSSNETHERMVTESLLEAAD